MGALRGFAKVTHDMTEGLRLIKSKRASGLSSHLQSARVEERTRVARDPHDVLGQQLVALKMDLSRLNQPTARRDATAQHRLSPGPAVQGQIDTIIASVRHIAGRITSADAGRFGVGCNP